MPIGYARVPTQDQNLELQRDALAESGCQKISEDKVGDTRVDRSGLAKAMEILREGDTQVVCKLDRLGCSVKHLVEPDRLHRYRHTSWPILPARHGQPGRNGTRADRRAHPHRARCRPPARPQGQSQAKDDRQQSRASQKAAGQRRSAQRRGQELWRVRSYVVPLGASLVTRLA